MNEFVEKRKEALGKLTLAQSSDPRQCNFGFESTKCFQGSTPVHCSIDYIVGFFWYPDRESMERALCEEEPFHHCDGEDPDSDHEILSGSIAAIVTECKEFGLDVLMERLLALKCGIYWVGKFTELSEGDSERAKEERVEFRENDSAMKEPDEDVRYGPDPIFDEKELDNFAYWMSEASDFRYR